MGDEPKIDKRADLLSAKKQVQYAIEGLNEVPLTLSNADKLQTCIGFLKNLIGNIEVELKALDLAEAQNAPKAN